MSDTANTPGAATTPTTNGDTSGKLPDCCSAPPDPDPGPDKG
ncbi:MAG TPA: hypothetical protein VGS07_31035 [Thermoanaerobaculia bacterium]|jgi:hypothetical protein|nr:hypothetical protein [Thermoanaerobaculia bacterium]